jgi:nitroreductase
MKNETIDCLLNHRSIRKYKPQPVESDKLELILTAGTRAATGGNLQQYTFVVIDDPEQLQALNEQIRDACNAPLAIIALADQYRVKRWFETFGVPSSTILNNSGWHFFMALWDALIALQNMVVGAESLGLGTCYNGNVVNIDIHDLLGAPEYTFPAGMIYLGYPDTNPESSSRLPLEAIVHKNKYQMPSDDDIRRFYEERNKVWDNLPADIKERLQQRGIRSIPEGVALRKYSREGNKIATGRDDAITIGDANRVILQNLRRSGFSLTPDDRQ